MENLDTAPISYSILSQIPTASLSLLMHLLTQPTTPVNPHLFSYLQLTGVLIALSPGRTDGA